METKLVVLFKEEIQSLIKFKYTLIKREIERHNITRAFSEDDLQQIKGLVFKSIWTWPQIYIDFDSRGGNSEMIKVSPHVAQQFITGGFHYSGSTIELVKVSYKIEFQGSQEALKISKGGGGAVQFWGNTSYEYFEIHFFSELKPSQELADEFKRQKNELLESIKSTLNRNQEYLTSEQFKFQAEVSNQVDAILMLKKDEGSRNDLFFG